MAKNLPANAEDTGNVGSIPGQGRYSGEGKEMATHASILAWEIPQTEEAGTWATVHGVAKSWTQLSTNTHIAP